MRHMIFLFLMMSYVPFAKAQKEFEQPLEQERVYIRRLCDSLPYFIKTGQAYLIEKSDCKLPGHTSYHIPHARQNFSKQVLELSGKKRDAYILMYSCMAVASVDVEKKDNENARTLFLNALTIAQKNDYHFEELHHIRKALNHICFLQGDYSAAMKITTEGLSVAEKINDMSAMAHYNNVLGYILLKQKNYEQSEKYYSTELDISRKIGDKAEEVKALENIAAVLIAENKLEKAIQLIFNAMNIRNANSKYFFPTQLISEKAFSYNKLAEIYKKLGRFKEALGYSSLSIQLSKKPGNQFHGNLYDVASYYNNAGDIYNRLKKPDSAIIYLRKGLKIADSIKHSEDLRDAYEQLSISFAMQKKFDSAWYYQNNFRLLNDSILNMTARQNIAFIQSQFDTERKDQQIKNQQARLKKQAFIRNMIILGAFLLLLVLGLAYNSYRLRQKNKFQQELNRQQNELINTVLAAQDKERKRIAEDLHDTLGSILSAAKLKLSATAEQGNGNGLYEETLDLLDEAVKEMRNISHNLLPASLLRLGLVAGLQNLLDKISSRSGLQINFVAYGFKERLNEIIEVSLYRIILESVNNIVKHAQANNVTVQLMQYTDYINVLIEDDGVGFDRKIVMQKPGMGLNSIFSRVDSMKAKIDIDTKPKAGTVINIDIPYRQTS